MNERCTKGTVALAAMIASRNLKSAEVVDAYLARIRAVNPQVNVVTATLAKEAREAATAVNRAVAAGTALGPLAGVPFTIKENIGFQGSVTPWGWPRCPSRSPLDSRS